MEKSLLVSIMVLVMINVTDSITSSVVSPSLIFYVTEMGGTKEDYGMIMSSYFLSGIAMMSFYGHWVDQNGNKYKAPYAASFSLGIVGSLIYFFAILMPQGKWAVYTILLGRLVTGMGASGRTLAYSYVATAIPRDDQRTTLTIMSMTRSFGMLLGPLLNLLVAEVNTSLKITSDLVLPINQNNSVGLIVAAGEILLFVAMLLFLTDPPPPKTKLQRPSSGEEEQTTKATVKEIFEAVSCFDLFLPMCTMFVFMFNFTLYAVAIPPVGNHALGWNPVQISNVLAAQAVILFVGMCASMAFSMKKAPDIYMIGFGNLCYIVGGTMTYLLWNDDSTMWQFVLPIMLVSFSYPFLGPANRSKFTKAVHARPELENAHGIMQSLFNQAFMVAGFLSPNFVASFVLRRPEDIGSLDGGNDHELTPWAWYIPISSTIIILGLLYEEFFLQKNELGFLGDDDDNDEDETKGAAPSETTTLLAPKKRSRRSTYSECSQAFSREFEVNRLSSVEANGIPNPFETSDEITLRNKLWKDKQEWEHLERIDAAMEEAEER